MTRSMYLLTGADRWIRVNVTPDGHGGGGLNATADVFKLGEATLYGRDDDTTELTVNIVAHHAIAYPHDGTVVACAYFQAVPE